MLSLLTYLLILDCSSHYGWQKNWISLKDAKHNYNVPIVLKYNYKYTYNNNNLNDY